MDTMVHGLYDAGAEHDACGIGTVVNIDGRADYRTLDDALSIVEKLEHRAGKDALEAEGTDVLLGEDTIACMRSGSAAACGIMLDGAVERAAEELHEPDLRLVVTGGLGRLVLPWIRRPVTYDPDLLLKGLLILYRNNAPDGKVKA